MAPEIATMQALTAEPIGLLSPNGQLLPLWPDPNSDQGTDFLVLGTDVFRAEWLQPGMQVSVCSENGQRCGTLLSRDELKPMVMRISVEWSDAPAPTHNA